MKRLLRLLGAVLLLGLLSSTSVANAQTTDLSEQGARAFADIAGCVAANDTLMVSVVVDQSGSLRSTDPANQRVGAIDTALHALSGLQATAQGDLDVLVNLAVFDEGYEELVGWGSLSEGHDQTLREAAVRELPARNQGAWTDYRAALSGPSASFAEARDSSERDPCKVVLWFTDGKLDVHSDTDLARTELCEPKGLVDGLRGSGIAIVALALFTTEGQGAVSAEDADLLRAVAEGTGDTVTCGTVPIPSTYTRGAYLHASNAEALSRVFAGAGTMIEGGIPGLSATCPGDGCIDGQLRIPLDTGLTGFRLVLDGVDPSRPPVLISPDGDSFPLETGEHALAEGRLTSSIRDGLAVVDLTFPGGGSSAGAWVLDTLATPQQVSVVDLYYFWGVGIEISSPEGMTIGESSPIQIQLSFVDGTPVSADDYQTLNVKLMVQDESVAVSSPATGAFVGDYVVPLTGAPSALDVVVEVEGVTSQSGVAVGPVTSSTKLQTVLPPSYATLLTSEIRLPQIVGLDSASSQLDFRGSERGETRVCVTGVDAAGPEIAGSITIATPEECIEIPANADISWPVTLTPETAADGRVEGSLTVSLSAVDGGEDIAVDVPVGGSMMRPVNQPLRWALVALFVIIGLLVPTLIAVLTNHLNGRFRVGPRSVRAQAPAVLSPLGLEPRGSEPLLTIDHFEGLKLGKPRRVTSLEGPITLRRRMPLWPFSEASFEARSDSGVLLSSVPPYTTGDGRRAPAMTSFRDVFYILVQESEVADDHRYTCELVVWDSEEPTLSEAVERRLLDLHQFNAWPDLVTAVESVLQASNDVEDERRQTPGQTSPHRQEVPADDPRARDAARPSLWDDDEPSFPPPPRSSAPPREAGPGPSHEPPRNRPPSIFDD